MNAAATPCPPRAFHRDQVGVSEQSPCTRGLGGPDMRPRNGDMPARGGEASASSFRPVGPLAAAVIARTIVELEEMLTDRAARRHVEGFDTTRQPNQRIA
jgi:hypothetical protein